MAGLESKVLLVVEDDPGVQKQLKWTFADYEVVLADNQASAISQLRRFQPQVVTLDLGLPPDPANPTQGFATLEEILKLAPATKVIVITGNDERENALKAVELGATDFYQKPIDTDTLKIIVQRSFQLASLEHEVKQLKDNQINAQGMIGNSPVVRRVMKMAERIAATEVSTMILGESGTGKEVLARTIHQQSPRAESPFIAINCASIPENLLESELFGFERGAFTGAHKMTKGKIECAHGGTLFLDEIGDMPYPLQAKLLRFLQERVIERIGGRQEISVDVKVISATHQDLKAMVEERSFREDLFYRLSEMTLELPPLREREEDVLLIARALLHKFNDEFNRNINSFSDDAVELLMSYPWPGNVRELQNKLKSAVIMADGKQITADDLMLSSQTDSNPLPINLREVREKAEKRAISKALSVCEGNMSKAAELLGVTRPTLYAHIEKYGLS